MEKDVLMSRVVKGTDRRYFFDVYDKPTGLLMTVKESRMQEGKSYSQNVCIWEDSLPEFVLTFLECLKDAGSDELLNRVSDRLLAKCQEEEKR